MAGRAAATVPTGDRSKLDRSDVSVLSKIAARRGREKKRRRFALRCCGAATRAALHAAQRRDRVPGLAGGVNRGAQRRRDFRPA
ncbi:UNVERIFIED_ORG: hypothetical protein M2438_001391 [Methylobacterium sp. SuP10 SLI 274]|nr:hypothetical protein [Methylorubrum extorquens]MDF9862603.1 hypothetical protein [Methylorubrum pseudosasae]MDH6636216.1 hypothetical protein [Methylobacterium sp. SuP10 SLI 274]MDH6665390.1 hypothetical protein [Methylorubrum zatmanii]